MAGHETTAAPRVFRVLAWVVLAVTVGVIISGDVVQATESGAGCGEHWPRCDGSLVPSIEDAATAIEFTHRAATFMLSALVVALYGLARRLFDPGHRIRRVMRWVVAFFVLEITIGALLVAFGWVEDDASIGRVVADGLHVVNTFFLLGAVALVTHLAAGRRLARMGRDRRLVAIGAAALIVVAVSGAINSLADTLFPADTVIEGIRDEFGVAAPFLLRVRPVHPVLAVLGGVLVFFIARRIGDEAASLDTKRRARFIQWVVGVQLGLGVLNLVLLTPLETQVLHLLAADVLWIALLLFGWSLTDGSAADPHVPRPELSEAAR